MADRPKGYGMTAELADKVRQLCRLLAIVLSLPYLHRYHGNSLFC